MTESSYSQEQGLARVRALLATAESFEADGNGEAAQSYRDQAEALRWKYRLEEAAIRATLPEAKLDTPGWKSWAIHDMRSEFGHAYRTIAYTVAQHVGVRQHMDWIWDEAARVQRVSMECAGYRSDLGYLDTLLTDCLLAFATKLEPHYDSNLSVEENVYRMRSAGMERGRIARAVWPDRFAGKASNYVDKPLNRRVSEIFAKESLRRGENPDEVLGRGNSMATYRKSYAEGFSNELWRRLSRMRMARGEESGAVVLRKDREAVDEMFYERYPHLRPAPVSPESGTYRSPNVDCERCKAAKSGYCREHGWMRPKKVKDAPYSYAGEARGTAAAQSVDLGTTGTARVSREDAKEIS